MKVFEPSGKTKASLRGAIKPAGFVARNDCDTAICSSCNCNCDDTYGVRAKALLAQN